MRATSAVKVLRGRGVRVHHLPMTPSPLPVRRPGREAAGAPAPQLMIDLTAAAPAPQPALDGVLSWLTSRES